MSDFLLEALLQSLQALQLAESDPRGTGTRAQLADAIKVCTQMDGTHTGIRDNGRKCVILCVTGSGRVRDWKALESEGVGLSVGPLSCGA